MELYKGLCWIVLIVFDITGLLLQFFIGFSPFFTTNTEADLHFGDTLQSLA